MAHSRTYRRSVTDNSLPAAVDDSARPASSAPRTCSRRALGALGERLACEHLQRLGLRVVARNVRTRHGEIDVIALDGAVLVFVEVKTLCERNARHAPEPLAGLRSKQRARLRRLAVAWLADCGGRRPRAAAIRFDAVGVSVDRRGRLMRLDHIEAAW